MIERFRHKMVELQVKTNMLKEHKCHFGEKDIPGELERIYNEMTYKNTKDTTDEVFLMGMHNMFTKVGIKPYKLITGDLIYMGVRMTDIDNQTKIEEDK